MYGGTTYGVAASVLSLSVNLFATVIVAYKAWISRRFIRKFMVSGDRTVQIERLFSILVESGMVYCTIWIFVVAWQVVVWQSTFSYNDSATAFEARFGDFINGGLVPIIAIYPAVVIILVAQNRSHMVKAFGGGAVNIPEPSRLNGIRASSATVLHIAQQGDDLGDISEESSTHAADE
ncbi:hypothetical protein BD309DRAFT_903604 [Dichomitus squalens]|nr:hypothetical protein BD309DRAFT_903604 [Dichomitus squalens]